MYIEDLSFCIHLHWILEESMKEAMTSQTRHIGKHNVNILNMIIYVENI